MAEPEDAGKRYNDPDGTTRPIEIQSAGDETLYGLLRRFIAGVVSSDPPRPLIQRLRSSFLDTAPHLRQASRNSARDLASWTRRGSPLRALLVISVGTITLLGLTGLLVFMLFLLAATLNAIIISFLMSLAAAGGFLALFFACLTAIYIGALSVAIFIISATTISTIIAVIVATGWVGFFWILWIAANKSLELTKRSLNMTGSALAAYSAARKGRHGASFRSAPIKTE